MDIICSEILTEEFFDYGILEIELKTKKAKTLKMHDFRSSFDGKKKERHP